MLYTFCCQEKSRHSIKTRLLLFHVSPPHPFREVTLFVGEPLQGFGPDFLFPRNVAADPKANLISATILPQTLRCQLGIRVCHNPHWQIHITRKKMYNSTHTRHTKTRMHTCRHILTYVHMQSKTHTRLQFSSDAPSSYVHTSKYAHHMEQRSIKTRSFARQTKYQQRNKEFL